MPKGNKPDCFKCKHFYTTWDASFPYGCKGFGMKSKRFPSLEVFLTSKRHCLLFAEKKRNRR